MEPKKEGLDAIIEQKMPRGEILRLYQAGELNNPEFLLLFSLDDEVFFKKYLRGIGEYKLPFDSTVPRDACFTNVPLLMRAFYSLYRKYPLYHFDRLLEYGLNRLIAHRFDLYYVLYLTHYQLNEEKEGRAAFQIAAAPILRKAAEYLSDDNIRGMLKNSRPYDAACYEDGLIGLCRAYNPLFVEAAGVSILPAEERRAGRTVGGSL